MRKPAACAGVTLHVPGIARQRLFLPVILNDISAIPTFISHHFNRSAPRHIYQEAIEVSDKYRWMYITKDTTGLERIVKYFVWSDVFVCPECSAEVVFFDRFVDSDTGEADREPQPLSVSPQAGGCRESAGGNSPPGNPAPWPGRRPGHAAEASRNEGSDSQPTLWSPRL